MNKKLLGSVMLGLSVMLGCVSPALADSRKVVTLGADLSVEQQDTMLRYFGVSADQVDIIYINNDDEREHLGSYVPLEQIGTRTFSCALVSPKTSGGIQVKTANLSWVTCNMIASTLSTSGVKNCQVVAASPFEVSGTGALTGVIMAYETANEVQLEPQKVELANEELVTTANLSDEIGQSKATAVINATKIEVVENNITDITEITNIVNNISNFYDVDITDDQSAEIAELVAKIAQQDYDITQLKATLERVQANVAGDAGADEETQKVLEESAILAEEEAKVAAESEAVENGVVFADEPEEEEESILDNTDVSALEESGAIVVEGDTTSTVLEQESENEETDIESITGIPEATEDGEVVIAGEEELVDEDEDDVEEETPVEENVKEEDLDPVDKMIYDDLKDELDDTFDGEVVSDSNDNTVYLTKEASEKLTETIEKYVLEVLVKGGDTVAEEEAKDEKISKNIMEETSSKAEDKHYEDTDFKQIDKFIRRLVFKDSEKLLADCQFEGNDDVVLYNGIMDALKKVFDMDLLDEEDFEENTAEETIDAETFDADTFDAGSEEAEEFVEEGADEFAEFVEEEASF